MSKSIAGADQWKRWARLILHWAGQRPWTTVIIEDIRCQEAPFGAQIGFAGKPIRYFPPHRYFEMYLEDRKYAFEAFCRWYEEWFVYRRAWKMPKSEGGWQDGSLARAVDRLHEEHGISLGGDFSKADSELVMKAIAERVEHYFGVLESIRQNGFKQWVGNPVGGVLKDGLAYLYSGHHRVSALSVLGYRTVEFQEVAIQRSRA